MRVQAKYLESDTSNRSYNRNTRIRMKKSGAKAPHLDQQCLRSWGFDFLHTRLDPPSLELDVSTLALSTAEVWDGAPTGLRMPLLLPHGAGRPQVARHNSWTDSFGSAGACKARKTAEAEAQEDEAKGQHLQVQKVRRAQARPRLQGMSARRESYRRRVVSKQSGW